MKIKGKILTSLLIITLVTFLSLRLITIYNLKEMETYLQSSLDKLVKTATEEGKQTLYQGAIRELTTNAQDRAELLHVHFREIASTVSLLAELIVISCSSPSGCQDSGEVVGHDQWAGHGRDIHVHPGSENPSSRLQDTRTLSFAKPFLEAVVQHSNHVVLAFMGSDAGSFVTTSGWVPPEEYDPRKRPWYQKALEAEGAVWVGPYQDAANDTLVMTCARAIFLNQGQRTLVVGVDSQVALLLKHFSGVHQNLGDMAFLLDQTGRVVALEREHEDDRTLPENLPLDLFTETRDPEYRRLALDMTQGKPGVAILHIDGVLQHVAFAPIPSLGWSIGIVATEENVVAPALKVERTMLERIREFYETVDDYLQLNQKSYFLIYLVVLASIVLMGIWFSKKITRPILALQHGARTIGAGNLDQSLQISTGDEIEDLANTFNQMSDDLKHYIENLKETTAVKERMENELRIAHQIQMDLVPKVFPPFPDRSDMDLYALLHPAREVGGDLYDFFFADGDHLYFAVADVSGKGVPAALFMAVTRTLLRAKAETGPPPHQIMDSMNRELCKNNEDAMFVTLFLGMLDTRTGKLDYCNAGHNLPYLLTGNGQLHTVEGTHGTPLGILDDMVYEQGSLQLNPEDRLVLYTDGISEAMNRDGVFYGEARIRESLAALSRKAPGLVAECLIKDLETFVQGAQQSDDITLLVLSYGGSRQDRA